MKGYATIIILVSLSSWAAAFAVAFSISGMSLLASITIANVAVIAINLLLTLVNLARL